MFEMKKYVILLFLMNFINLQSQSYLYQNERTYVISAEAEIRMKPDQVYFYVGIELRGTKLAETKARVSKVINDVIAYSKSKGIELKNIQTTHISIIPNYEHRSEFTEIGNYSVSQNIGILLEDVALYDELITKMIDLGINKVQDIRFSLSNYNEIKKKARIKAVEAAKAKGKEIVELVDQKLGKIIHINADENYYLSQIPNIVSNYTANSFQQNEEAIDGLALGMISVKSRVTLHFSLLE